MGICKQTAEDIAITYSGKTGSFSYVLIAVELIFIIILIYAIIRLSKE